MFTLSVNACEYEKLHLNNFHLKVLQILTTFTLGITNFDHFYLNQRKKAKIQKSWGKNTASF